MHVTLVHVSVKPEGIAAFIAATADNHRHAVQEPGNLRFDVLQLASDPGHFVLYEAYVDEAAAAAHKDTAHYRRWRDAVADLMAAPREGVRYTSLYPGAP